MKYQAELHFLQNLFNNMNLNIRVEEEPLQDIKSIDYGLRQFLNPDVNYTTYLKGFASSCKSNAINQVQDEFSFKYLILVLSDSDISSYLFIGPFTLEPFTENHILKLAEKYRINPEHFHAFNYFFKKVPVITDSNLFYTILNTFGNLLWGSMDNYSYNHLEFESKYFNSLSYTDSRETESSEDLFNTMQILEERYRIENELMHSVSLGQLHKVETLIDSVTPDFFAHRIDDSIRNLKNYAIVVNTLLRKAIEAGAVHPLYIDQISSKYAQRIELTNSKRALFSLMKEMPRKYALATKNHSLKGFSPPVRKVMMNVYTNLSGDLSLKAHAEMLNISPSYLSNLFKKETGYTLTEYVNIQRVQHAVFLLNSTELQIQTIAQYCGFSDICYFTKTFKKLIGKTPTEYRNILLYRKE